MLFVPLYVEGIRSHPSVVFWFASLAQAVLWVLVPLLCYAAPPGELPSLLAVGHQFPLGGQFPPPLAYWVGEVAFRIAGLFGVYALSQLCVLVTYWCVFALGSATIGAAHGALAVLLMTGISAFTVPTPDFGPAVLTMALWAVVLLHYWRAVAQKRPRSWYVLGCAAALILLASNAAIILLGLLALFTAVTKPGAAALRATEPRIVATALVGVLFAHLFWLQGLGDGLGPTLARLRGASAAGENTVAWLRLVVAIVLAHAGLAVLVVLASGWPRSRAQPAPAIARLPADLFAFTFVKVFALVPALLATIVAVLVGDHEPIGGAPPLLVLSGLAVVAAAGDNIALHHQRILGFAWAGLLLVPALFVPIALIALPWTTGADLRVAQPAAAMGHFFAETFERRTGHPLAIVGGDERTAALVALAAPSRPRIYIDANPARSPWINADDIRKQGAVVVWPTADTSPTPPPEIKAHFPDLIPEVPHLFERPIQGRLPPLRIGWGVIRPANAPAPPGQ